MEEMLILSSAPPPFGSLEKSDEMRTAADGGGGIREEEEEGGCCCCSVLGLDGEIRLMTVPMAWRVEPVKECFRDDGCEESPVSVPVESDAAADVSATAAAATAAAAAWASLSSCGVSACWSMSGRRCFISLRVFLNLKVFLLCAFCRCSRPFGTADATDAEADADAAEDSCSCCEEVTASLTEESEVTSDAFLDSGSCVPAGVRPPPSPPPGSEVTDCLLLCDRVCLTARCLVSRVFFRYSFGSDVALFERMSWMTERTKKFTNPANIASMHLVMGCPNPSRNSRKRIPYSNLEQLKLRPHY